MQNTAAQPENSTSYALRAVDIVKLFPGVLANDHVSIDFERGKVHSLLGENGAGKSTLMNVIYGLYRADEGKVVINGEEKVLSSPADAIAAGVGMVHQHFMLVDTVTVLENIIIGTRNRAEPIIDFKTARKKVEELAASLGFEMDVNQKTQALSVGEMQRVEIVKALYRGADILILDEPTAVLTPQEIQDFFVLIENFKKAGKTIIFISHKLNEVMQISDDITILRQGKVVARTKPQDCTQEELASLMVGRPLNPPREVPCNPGQSIIQVKELSLKKNRSTFSLKNIRLDLKAGTIVGVAGVDGNGQTELAEVLSGMRRASAGKVFFCGEDVTLKGAHYLYSKGLGHIPADRNKHGSMPHMTLTENLMLQDYCKKPFSKAGFLQRPAMNMRADELIGLYDVRPKNREAKADTLSGGNRQKVIIAREVSRNPPFLIAVFPTRGLDVGAIEFVHESILEQKAAGSAILLISTELEEVFQLSDYIAVMYEGEIVCLKDKQATNFDEIGLYMAGARRDEM